MARKRKNVLPSGNYRVLIRYKDENGVTHNKSITAPTKAEAQAKAYEWKTNHSNSKSPSMTISDAVAKYIDIKEKVLSVSTIAGYRRIYRNHVEDTEFGEKDIDQIDSAILQLWISELCNGHSAKTVMNIYGLIKSALKMFAPDKSLNVTLPQREKTDLYCPSSDEISKVISAIKEKGDDDLLLAVMLAAFGTLRRSEICALTSDDVKGNVVTVRHALVMDDDRSLVVKTTKTYDSQREVEMPDAVVSLLKGREGRLINMTPDCLSERFTAILVKAGVPHFRFHDLRHYSASIMHAIGVPDQYIMDRGGWTTDGVMKRVYRNTISDEKRKQTKAINTYFDDVINRS